LESRRPEDGRGWQTEHEGIVVGLHERGSGPGDRFSLPYFPVADVFADRRYAAARRGLLLSGMLCLAGLLGPATNNLAWRGIGIFGYAVVFPITCLAPSRAFAADALVARHAVPVSVERDRNRGVAHLAR
jgi:hypothetical protein